MFKNMFKTKKQREHERKILKQKYLIELAETNGIYIPPAFRPAEVISPQHKNIIGMHPGWYTSLDRRAKIAERELKKRGLM